MAEIIKGAIERVVFHNPETGFCVLRVSVKGRPELAPVLGVLPSVQVGEAVEAEGRWVVDPTHGPQFRADRLKTAPPSSPQAVEKYLGSGSIKGIGPHLAAKIVRCFGAKTVEVLDHRPADLADIRGIGAKRLARIKESWNEQRKVREIVLFLQQHGVGGGRAVRIHRLYGDNAIAIIKANPYRLTQDIRGVGFKTADGLARSMGHAPDSPFRIRAAIRHVLSQLASEGHCGGMETEVIERTIELVGVASELVVSGLKSEVADKLIVREDLDGATAYFPPALHRAEREIASSIHRLMRLGAYPLASIKVEAAIQWVEGRNKTRLSEGQKNAIGEACRHPVVIVTGGPGVGKTTLIRSLAEIVSAKKWSIVLAAPTGRAAKRMAEATGRPAQTIHRLLEFDGGAGEFKRNFRRPLEGDLFILDESSMIDVLLAAHFFDAVPSGAGVVLVGDVDQLPSVGPGAVLSDLIASSALVVVKLTEIFRQAKESRIIAAAMDIQAGRIPDLSAPENLTDFYFVPADDPQGARDLVVELVKDRLPAKFAFDAMKDIQVLSPMNKGALGAQALNAALQAALNPPPGGAGRDEVERYGWTFRSGDRVIQLENNYDKEVYNGDLGTIERIDLVEQEVTVSFENRKVEYDFGDLDQLALSYALTIHKSQGSEYPCVVLVLHAQHFVLLRRNLVYTGLTRGKRLVVLVGTRRALSLAVSRPDDRTRLTLLKRWMRNARA